MPPVLVPKPEDVPGGYRSADGGLIVPETVARTREVWTKSEVKEIDRATRFLKVRAVLFQFCCKKCGPRKGMALVRDEQTGQRVLRCGCTDRVLSGAL